MKTPERQLRHRLEVLLKAAGRASAESRDPDRSEAAAVASAPPWFAARVVAQWRARAAADADRSWQVATRRALACATGLMLLSVALNWGVFRGSPPWEGAVSQATVGWILAR